MPALDRPCNKANPTQEDLAAHLKLNTSAVGQWETGRTVPLTMHLTPLADVPDVSVDSLLGRVEDSGKRSVPDNGTLADDLQLVAEARMLDIDLRQVIAAARQQRWQEENREALADANAFVARNELMERREAHVLIQCDVHQNDDDRSGNIPYLLDIQANLLSDLQTRDRYPLIRKSAFGRRATRLHPQLTVDRKRCSNGDASYGSAKTAGPGRRCCLTW